MRTLFQWRFLASITCIVIVLFIVPKFVSSRNKHEHMIGILQTASHPALDMVKDSFMNHIKQEFGDSVGFVVRNAQGNVSTAHMIAQQFHTDDQIDLLFAIATPAAQACAQVEKVKPAVFAAVTDPENLGLLKANANIFGVTDRINIEAQVDLIKQLLPSVTSCALLYNVGEVNSSVLVKQMKDVLTKHGITVRMSGFAQESDIPHVVQAALASFDCVWAPTDNSVALALNSIAGFARTARKPLFVSDSTLVNRGALAAAGVSYEANGRQAAQIAEGLLKGIQPATRITEPEVQEPVINHDVLTELGLNTRDSKDVA